MIAVKRMKSGGGCHRTLRRSAHSNWIARGVAVRTARSAGVKVELRARGQRTLRGNHFLRLELAQWANQDDAGDTHTVDALHIPTVAQGFLRAWQWMVAVPAAPLARGADRMQCIADVQPGPLLCFNCAQTHLRSIPSFRKRPMPLCARHQSRKKVMEPYQIFVSP